MVLENITYYQIFGIPLIAYGGIFTLICFLATAYLGHLNFKKGKANMFKWHIILARISILLAFLHGTLGVLAYF